MKQTSFIAAWYVKGATALSAMTLALALRWRRLHADRCQGSVSGV